MEKKNNEIIEKQGFELTEKKISRKEAIKKTGYMAASAATMMILLNKKAQGKGPPASTPVGPGGGVGTTPGTNTGQN